MTTRTACTCTPQTYDHPAEPDEGCSEHFEPCTVAGCKGTKTKGDNDSTCGNAEDHCSRCGEDLGCYQVGEERTPQHRRLCAVCVNVELADKLSLDDLYEFSPFYLDDRSIVDACPCGRFCSWAAWQARPSRGVLPLEGHHSGAYLQHTDCPCGSTRSIVRFPEASVVAVLPVGVTSLGGAA